MTVSFEECHGWDDRITHCNACGSQPGYGCQYKYEED